MKEYWYGYVSDFLTPKETDFRYMDVREEPFEIHGIFELAKDNYYRLPLVFAKTVSEDVTKQMRAGAIPMIWGCITWRRESEKCFHNSENEVS